MEWIQGTPSNEDLKVIFSRDDGEYEVLGGTFLVSNGKEVWVENFQRPPKDDGGWYLGYWGRPDAGITHWMKLPEPPKP